MQRNELCLNANHMKIYSAWFKWGSGPCVFSNSVNLIVLICDVLEMWHFFLFVQVALLKLWCFSEVNRGKFDLKCHA